MGVGVHPGNDETWICHHHHTLTQPPTPLDKGPVSTQEALTDPCDSHSGHAGSLNTRWETWNPGEEFPEKQAGLHELMILLDNASIIRADLIHSLKCFPKRLCLALGLAINKKCIRIQVFSFLLKVFWSVIMFLHGFLSGTTVLWHSTRSECNLIVWLQCFLDFEPTIFESLHSCSNQVKIICKPFLINRHNPWCFTEQQWMQPQRTNEVTLLVNDDKGKLNKIHWLLWLMNKNFFYLFCMCL